MAKRQSKKDLSVFTGLRLLAVPTIVFTLVSLGIIASIAILFLQTSGSPENFLNSVTAFTVFALTLSVLCYQIAPLKKKDSEERKRYESMAIYFSLSALLLFASFMYLKFLSFSTMFLIFMFTIIFAFILFVLNCWMFIMEQWDSTTRIPVSELPRFMFGEKISKFRNQFDKLSKKEKSAFTLKFSLLFSIIFIAFFIYVLSLYR